MPNAPHFQTPATFNRLDRLRARRIDAIEKQATLNEVYDRMASESSSAVKYAIGAMQPIDPDYTANTYREGDRVKNQIEKAGLACWFEYQGSVTSDTHIKARSDIDLLTLSCRFVTVDSPGPVGNPYRGNTLDDLMALRRDSTLVMQNKFPEATVDSSGAKSVSIEGGSLRRKIDVVSSNWRNTVAYERSGQQRDRGVDVLDAKVRTTVQNLPFLHNDRIHTKDQRSLGGLRKAIRLLKSLRYDSTRGVDLSSYDIAAIAYRMEDSELFVVRGAELLLVERCKRHLDFLAANTALRESLYVPNETRKIFCSEGASLNGLNQLRVEVDQLRHEIENDLTRSFRKLAEARIAYA